MATSVNISDVVQTDDLIERDRVSRVVVALATPVVLLFAGWMLGSWMSAWFHLPGFLSHLGYSAGLGLGAFCATLVWSRSFIKNDATIAFGTINPLASLFNLNPIVFYGPGFHFCFFWEQRSKDNVVNLVEMPVSFKDVRVQCADGEIKMKGSARLRADIKQLPKFIGGAAAIASDITGLMIAESIGIVGTMTVREAASKIKEVNIELAKKFQHGGNEQSNKVTGFEERFGVIIGDVTIEEILPAQEIQETMGTKAEMAIIHEIVANRFGKTTMAEVEALIQEGKLLREDVSRVVTQVMAASGNLQGMDLKDHNINFNIGGLGDLNPEAAGAFGTAFAAAAGMMGRAETKQNPKGSKS